MRIGSTQSYRGYTIRRTDAGWAVELPSGAHFETRWSYASAIRLIDAHVKIAAIAAEHPLLGDPDHYL